MRYVSAALPALVGLAMSRGINLEVVNNDAGQYPIGAPSAKSIGADSSMGPLSSSYSSSNTINTLNRRQICTCSSGSPSWTPGPCSCSVHCSDAETPDLSSPTRTVDRRQVCMTCTASTGAIDAAPVKRDSFPECDDLDTTELFDACVSAIAGLVPQMTSQCDTVKASPPTLGLTGVTSSPAIEAPGSTQTGCLLNLLSRFGAGLTSTESTWTIPRTDLIRVVKETEIGSTNSKGSTFLTRQATALPTVKTPNPQTINPFTTCTLDFNERLTRVGTNGDTVLVSGKRTAIVGSTTAVIEATGAVHPSEGFFIQSLGFTAYPPSPAPTLKTRGTRPFLFARQNDSTTTNTTTSLMTTTSTTTTPYTLNSTTTTVSGATCSPLPTGSLPLPTPNTDTAFTNFSSYSDVSNAAAAPNGYTRAFVDQTCLYYDNTTRYLGTRVLSDYSTEQCASYCDQEPTCKGFNIFIERDPVVVPGANCPNPDATALVKCALWRSAVSFGSCNITGRYITPPANQSLHLIMAQSVPNNQSFHVVVAGSNGYNNIRPLPLAGFTGPVPYNGSIYQPPDQGPNSTFIMSRFLNQSYDANVCAQLCNTTTLENQAQAVSTNSSTYRPCNYFNSFLVSVDGVTQGLYCALFTQSQSTNNTVITNVTSNGHTYSISYSYGFALRWQKTGNMQDDTLKKRDESMSVVVSEADAYGHTTVAAISFTSGIAIMDTTNNGLGKRDPQTSTVYSGPPVTVDLISGATPDAPTTSSGTVSTVQVTTVSPVTSVITVGSPVSVIVTSTSKSKTKTKTESATETTTKTKTKTKIISTVTTGITTTKTKTKTKSTTTTTTAQILAAPAVDSASISSAVSAMMSTPSAGTTSPAKRDMTTQDVETIISDESDRISSTMIVSDSNIASHITQTTHYIATVFSMPTSSSYDDDDDDDDDDEDDDDDTGIPFTLSYSTTSSDDQDTSSPYSTSASTTGSSYNYDTSSSYSTSFVWTETASATSSSWIA